MTGAADAAAAFAPARNLRDLGGLPAAGGQAVRRGVLFRSAALHELSDADRAALQALGLALVVNLRSNGERARHPTVTDAVLWFRDHERSAGDLSGPWRRPGRSAADVRGLMIEVYRTLAEEQAPSYAELLRRIAAGELPVLFHCAAGKDRTGIIAAILLELLGVPREAIERDYLLTGNRLLPGTDGIRAAVERIGLPAGDESVYASLFGVDAAYLRTMFEALEEGYGSVAGFAGRRLGLEPSALGELRRRLLVPN